MSFSDDFQYVVVCPVSAIPLGMGRAYQIGLERIALFRTRRGRIFATAQVCPHRGGPLADGMLVEEQVVCPLHAFRFDLHTGACEQQQVCSLRTYPVHVTPDGFVHVGIPLSNSGSTQCSDRSAVV
ncbi:MAG: nitrite reductase small subunit NirD [Gemmataceae bacterium]|nr:nitrite reductase small subunit NirD [Gemmataceae bacterium]